MKIKKIAIVIASRANYGRSKSLIKAISDHSKLELFLVLAGSALIDSLGNTKNTILKDGFKINYECNYALMGSDLRSQSTTTGLAIIQLTEVFKNINPDFVVTIADRYETMATAISASYQNIPLIHLQGGDISGNIDDKVRHAITRLSDYHFPASLNSYRNLIAMGENKKTIWMHGCPSMDIINNCPNKKDLFAFIREQYNYKFIQKSQYILILMHPLTDDSEESPEIIRNLSISLRDFNYLNFVVIAPNIDSGFSLIRSLLSNNLNKNFKNLFFIEALPPNHFVSLIKYSNLCIGNSSSFLREAAILGKPSIILGNRQNGREMGNNCIHLKNPDGIEISKNIIIQLEKISFESDYRFGKGNAGEKIANTIANLPFGFKPKSKLFS